MMQLVNVIKTYLEQHGDMSFADFMQQALYAPQFGYYSSGLPKLGKDGDFITAPELTPLFGQTLAMQCQQILSTLVNPTLFEFGAGTGRLAVDLLSALEKNQSLPESYCILEVSASLRQCQQALIEKEIPHLLDRIQWLNAWPQSPFNGVIIANEVLDAMPVHRFLQTADGIEESFVKLNEAGEFIEFYKPCTNPRLLHAVQESLSSELHPYQSEVNLFLDHWLKECFAMLGQGAMFIIDYGFPQHEYFHADRNTGTLMCHYRHLAHSNPFIHLGEQDITAHVNFSQVAHAGFSAGFHIAGYCNQASFLLANGLLSLVEQIKDEHQRLKALPAVKQLIQPSEMGELFKVIALTKGIDFPLTGFQLQDKRASL